jgi:hypothetical protein
VPRTALGGVEEETPLAEAEFELDRVVVAEQAREVEEGILDRLIVEGDQQRGSGGHGQ